MAANWKKNYSNYRSFIVSNFSHYRQRSDLKAYMELFLSLASIIIFSVFALRPTLLAIAKLYKEIEANDKTIQTMDTKIANLRKVQALSEQESQSIDLLNSAIPANPLPDEFVRQLEGISLESESLVTAMSVSGMELLGAGDSKLSQGVGKLPSGVKNFSFSISAISGYPELFDMLTQLENLRRVAIVNSVNIQPQTTKLGRFVNINVTAYTPYVPDGNQIVFSGNSKK